MASKRIVMTAAIGCALAVPSVGMAAVAGVQDDRLPTIPLNGLDARVGQIAATGAKVVRVDLLWSQVAPVKPASPGNPADPAYRFATYDTIFLGLATRGITPIVTVYSSPRWAAGGKRGSTGQQWNNAAPNAGQFGLFMSAVAQRYNGRFQAAGDVLGQYTLLPTVRHYEIWNEPNLQLFLSPQFDKRKRPVASKTYVNLVKAAYPRIKAANPRAIVIAGVTGPKGKTDSTGQGTMDWLKALQRSKPRMDAYSQHIYPAQPPLSRTTAIPSWNSVPRLLAESAKIKRGLPMYITEAGYTTGTTRYRKVKVTVAQQNKYLKQIYSLKQARSSRIPLIVWFNYQDNPFWPGGLLRANGSKKPSYASFRTIARKTRTLPAALRTGAAPV
jgi:hypothetical protein